MPAPTGSSEREAALARLRDGPIPRFLPILLGFLTAAGPLSTDAYLPAFPAIEASLHAARGSAQLTLAAWFAGLAVGQIVQGPLSDRFGRRAPVVAGTLLFTLASVGCAASPGIAVMCVFRFLAAFGASASAVVPRAVVRDLRDGHEARRLMAQLILVMGAVPILAPSLGGLLLTVASWRAIFWLAAAYGLGAALCAWRLLPETLPPERRVRVRIGDQLVRYWAIGRERSFLAHSLLGGMALFSLFAYLGGSPVAYVREYGLTPAQYALAFSANAAVYIGAAQFTVPLAARFGVAAVLRVGTSCLLAAALVLLAVALTGAGGLAGLLVGIGLNMACMGAITPIAPVAALSPHAAHAGSASALLGTLQFVLGALAAFAVGMLDDGTAVPLAGMMLLGAFGAKVASLFRPQGSVGE